MTNWNTWSVTKTQTKLNTYKKPMDDSWRHWIGENLLLGNAPNVIAHRMVEGGFDYATAQHEVTSAANHPYIKAGMALDKKIKKRDWILDNYRLLAQESLSFGIIERKHKLSRDDFLRDYYTTNRPVIIQGAMDNWAALKKWNPDWLKQQFGNRMVEVQTNRNADCFYEINMEHHRERMLLSDYVTMITGNEPTNDVYMTASNGSINSQALNKLWEDIDMLPEYLDSSSERKGFLWFGPAGTITPLHHDLTNNFMAQVYGRKLIKLILSYNMPYVYNHLHCYSEIDLGNIDYVRYPLLKKANIIELILEPGEILFLPVGCWHYVQGLDISITMSFTNFLFKNDFSSHYTTYNDI
jgi:hypothetical protein